MENKKQLGSSSSSSPFTSDLFGSKQLPQPSASAGTSASIFPPPSKVLGRNSCLELNGYTQNQSSGNHVCGTKQGTADIMTQKSKGASNSTTNKERKIFQDRVETSPLSSSLYYGGHEDMYVRSSSTQASDSNPIFKKDEFDEDPNGNNSQSASRGNWWQGSLYY